MWSPSLPCVTHHAACVHVLTGNLTAYAVTRHDLEETMNELAIKFCVTGLIVGVLASIHEYLFNRIGTPPLVPESEAV